ncbi:unnamed protein product [Cuscuta epithymum]|uniref:Uncharacterized protein n=1 Tax=Cuscuta epithymum TaxID=186058 RepID=A0AAV0DUJ9_9ASTE|nr:unnamed protein product [Cuscuta epithymum]
MDNKTTLGNNNVLILVVVCFLLLVLVGILGNHKYHKSTEADTEATMITMMISPLPPSNNIMIRKTMRQPYSLRHHTHKSIKYVSKRSVPNGSNPLHNSGMA